MGAVLGYLSVGIGLMVVIIVGAKYKSYATALTVAFGLRATAAIVDVYVFMLPGQSDSIGFEHYGFYWARNGVLGTFEHFGTGAHLYTWLISFFYALFDRSQLMMQAINVLFGSLMVVNVGLLVKQLGGTDQSSRTAAWLTAVFPSLIYWSAVLLREVVVAYPLSLGALYLARWYGERKATQMAAAVACLLVSMAFHSGALAVLLAAGVWMLGGWVRSLFTAGFHNLGRNSIALVAGAGAIVFVFSSGFGMQKFQRVESGDVEHLSESQSSFSRGRAGYLQDFHPETGTDVAVQAPLRLVYFLFAPFPWMLRTGSDIVGILDSGFFFFLFLRIWRQRKSFAVRPDRLLLFAVFGAMALTFATGVSNYGTALRHRNKMLPLLIAVAFSVPWRLPRQARSPASPAFSPARLPHPGSSRTR